MSRRKSVTQHNLEQAVVSRLTASFSWLARRLPLRTLRRLADAVAWVIMGLSQKRQRLAAANIAAAFPELSAREHTAIRRGCVRSICRTMIEMLKLPALSPEALSELVRLEAGPWLREILQERGIILLTAHYSNWEWFGARLAHEVPITVIARDAAHDLTAELINSARESHGVKVIGREDLRRMIGVLRGHEMLGILPDQHALQGGILTDFLGRPAWSFTGPALLAARTGAAVVPAFAVRQPDGNYVIEVQEPLALVDTADRDADLVTNTQIILDAIAAAVRRHPDQWLWLHDRWKSKQADAAEATATEAVQ